MQSSGIKDHNDCRPQSDLQGTYYLALLRQDNSDDLKGSCYPHHETILDSPDDLSNPEEDQDPTMATVTVRSVIVGVVMALIGGAIAQLFVFKPVLMSVHALVLQVACVVLSQVLAKIEGPKWWNPHPLTIKETVFSSIMATSAAAGTFGVEVMGAQDLIFGNRLPFGSGIILLLSVQMIGFSFAGLLRPLVVQPAQTPFPSILPSVSLLKTMSKQTEATKDQVSMFKKTFGGVLLYEIFPSYLAPALQAISPWCLSLPKVPTVTHLFGGSLVAEGMGLFSLSADWSLVGSYGPMFIPLKFQIIDWVSGFFAVFLMSAAYRYDWFGGASLPFISFELLDQTGKAYDFKKTVNSDGTQNSLGVQEIGLPTFSTALIIGLSGILLAASSSITTGAFFHWNEISGIFKHRSDQHRCNPYRDVQSCTFATFAIISLLSTGACLWMINSGLSWSALATVLISSAILSLAVGLFFGQVGLQLPCNAVFQLLAGILFPGNAIRSMWFTMVGGTIVTKCTLTMSDMKLGQYMHLSPLSVLGSQVVGTLVGSGVHLGTMRMILDSKREVLLLRHGDGVYTGWNLTTLAAQSTTWGLFSRQLYFPGQKYAILPYCLIIGFFLPIPLFLLHKWRPHSGFDKLNIPLFASSIYNCIRGATSGRTMAMIIGFYTQYVLQKHHSSWYRKYNYIISAALDGGTELAILLLSLTFQGGSGWNLKVPTYFLNPDGPRDFCFSE